MAIDEVVFRPGDTDNNLLRKILATLHGAGGSSNIVTVAGGSVTVAGGSLTGGGAVTIADGADQAEGARSDSAVTNPALSASVISLLKGAISFEAAIGVNTAGADTKLGDINGNLGTVSDAAVVNPGLSASAISLLKGILTETSITAGDTTDILTSAGDPTDAAVTNPASAASIIAALKGILTADNLTNTNVGAVADAAVTNPASSASVIAALKGILTGVNLNQNVGGYTSVIKDTTAVSTSPAYTAGDAVGGKRTFTSALRTSGGTGILESVTILDRANQKAAMELFIFDSDPSAATITDNSAFVFSTDDLKVLAHVTIAATDYITINSKAVATIKGIGAALKGNATANLYGALVTTGTPTYAATTDVQLILGVLQD